MKTWLRRMRLLSAAQTALTVLRVLATVRFAAAVVYEGNVYRLKRKGH